MSTATINQEIGNFIISEPQPFERLTYLTDFMLNKVCVGKKEWTTYKSFVAENHSSMPDFEVFFTYGFSTVLSAEVTDGMFNIIKYTPNTEVEDQDITEAITLLNKLSIGLQ